jgi:hypothetical protein
MFSLVHPHGWLAGFRAGFAPGLLLVLSVLALLVGWTTQALPLLMAGLSLASAAVLSGVALAYAAASADRRRGLSTRRASTPHQLRGDEVFEIIAHIDTKVDGLETKILSVIKEGREAHTKEHAEQRLACARSMRPLEVYVSAAQKADERRDARVKPLVSAAEWVTNHWAVSLAVAAAIAAALVRLGVVQ